MKRKLFLFLTVFVLFCFNITTEEYGGYGSQEYHEFFLGEGENSGDSANPQDPSGHAYPDPSEDMSDQELAEISEKGNPQQKEKAKEMLQERETQRINTALEGEGEQLLQDSETTLDEALAETPLPDEDAAVSDSQVEEDFQAAEDAKDSGEQTLLAEAEENVSELESAETVENSEEKGDPVLIAEGMYVQKETDIGFNQANGFSVNRRYTSNTDVSTSFGYGWTTNLDQRIILGTEPSPEALYQNLIDYSESLNQIIQDYEKALKDYFGINIYEAYDEYTRRRVVCDNYLGELDNLLSSAENLYNRAKGYKAQEGIGLVVSQIREHIGTILQKKNLFENLIIEIDRHLYKLALFKQKYNQSQELLQNKSVIYNLSLERKNRNRAAMAGGLPLYYEETGLDTLTFIDEENYPHVFRQVDDNIWISEKDRFIICRQEGDVIVLEEYGGIEKYFDSQGFLVRIQDRNSNFIEIKRDENERIEYIRNSFGEELDFYYSGSFISGIVNARDSSEKIAYTYEHSRLVAVTDADADTVTMNYDSNGRMTELKKCDGSSVKFTYGEVTSDHKVLVTATTNEEGYDEQFYYDRNANMTVYTDHDGNSSYYMYDENYRTVREELSDGSVIIKDYDSKGNLICLIENGNKTTYFYDDRGNVLQTAYGDGSCETWTYDSHGLVTSYTDRDGVYYEYMRNSNGDLLEYKAAGRTVYSQRVNSKGLVIQCAVYGQTPVITDYEYDSYGNRIAERCGEIRKEYSYDNRNRLVSISINGRVVSKYGYDRHLITKENYNGLITYWITNGRKDVTDIIQKDSVTGKIHKTKIEYDKRHLPLKIFTGDGKTEKLLSSYLYTREGRLEAEIYHGQECWVKMYEYSNGKITQIKQFKTTQDAGVTEPVEAQLQQLLKAAGQNVFIQKCNYEIQSNNKKLMTITDGLGVQSFFQYDSYGNLVNYTDGNGNARSMTYTNNGKISSEQSVYGGWYDYDYPDVSLTSVKERGGVAACTEYYPDGSIKKTTDRYGKETVYSYDNMGRILSVQSESRKTWYEYDSFNRIVKQVIGNSPDENTGVYYVTYEYSKNGRSVIATQGGKYKTVHELDAFGNITKQTDGNGNTKRYEYDTQNQLIAFYDGYENKMSYEYNALGKLSKTVFPDNAVTEYSFNYMGQLEKVTDSCGVVYTAVYDKAGRLKSEWTRADSEKTYEYDNGGRIVKVLCGGEIVEAYTYGNNNRSVTVKDGNGNDYLYSYDAFGRLVKEKNRSGHELSYTYDAGGQVKTFTDFDETTTSIVYSSDRTEKTVAYPDGTKNRFVFNAIGNIIEAQNDYDKTVYIYDQGAKLICQKNITTGEEIYFEYDAAGNRTGLKSSNRESRYLYGKNNEVLEVFDNKQRLGITLKYDSNGREVLRQFANGITQATFYDKAGRVVLITQKSGHNELQWAEGYVYAADGKRIATVDNKAKLTMYEYNKKGQLCVVWYPYSTELEQNLKLEAQENGLPAVNSTGQNRFLTASERNSIVPLLEQMHYGLSASLSNLQIFIKEEFAYDRNSNRISKTNSYGKISYSYDSENRLIFSGANGKSIVKYTYDRKGNLLTQESELKNRSYSYNSQNRLVYSEVTDKAQKTYTRTAYAYDAFGRRIIVQDNNDAALRTLYDGFSFDVIKQSPVFDNGLFADSSQTGIRWSNTGKPTGDRYRYISDEESSDGNRYYYLDQNNYKCVSSRYLGERTSLSVNGSLTAQSSGEGTRYYTLDLLGSVRATTDELGLTKTINSYDAFGSLVHGTATGTSDYAYLSKQFDSATTFYNYGYRDYNPSTARFTTSDPLRDGSNWFAYCDNDPVNFVDLFGLCAEIYLDLSGVPPQYRELLIERYTILQIHGHLLRSEDSYSTVNGQNPENRGKDLLIIENPVTGESIIIPVSSIANMDGTTLADSLDEKDFVLTYDTTVQSKYAPYVFTITEGTLFPEIPKTVGESIKKDGTTKDNKKPWRGHNTKKWGSEGCITAQEDNPGGDMTDVINKLKEWGIKDKCDIPVSFGLGTK